MPDFLNMPIGQFILFLAVYFPVRSLIVAVLTHYFVLHSRFGKDRTVYRDGHFGGQFMKELRGAPQTIVADILVFAIAVGCHLFKNNPPTFGNILLATALAFCWTEFWFYGMHRALHSKRLFPLHRQHHLGRVVHPLTFLSFSVSERLLQTGGTVFVFAALSHVLPLAFAGFVLYAVIAIVCDIIAHLNVEIFPSGYSESWFGKLFFSPTYHAMHHARFTGHYGLFTPWFDRLFQTDFNDYSELFESSVRGTGNLVTTKKGKPA